MNMQNPQTIAAMRQLCQSWCEQKLSIALVPTMGNLHAGHLSLIEKAKQSADCVVVSIFVNPLQFAPNEDFASYPRTLAQDLEKLTALDVNAAFTPAVDEIYLQAHEKQAKVVVPDLSAELCGITRPHFFYGVTTVVAKLFNIVQPHMAVFGEKDYQQLVIIKRMVTELCFPIKIISSPIVRETDGLAMSSRNQYLDTQQRKQTDLLYRMLCALKNRIKSGEKNYQQLSAQGVAMLEKHGFQPDYVSIRRREDLAHPEVTDNNLIILVAAWLGKTRLIDNIFI